MTLTINKIKKSDYEALYNFLKKVEFPYLPEDKNIAFNELSKSNNHIYLGMADSKIELFLCFSEKNNKLFFDIACSKKYENKWACKLTMRFIFNTAFKVLKYPDFYVESFTQKARNVVEKFGFRKIKGCVYKLEGSSLIVKKYLKNKESNTK